MKTLFENEKVKVSETGRDYDFIATIENKTQDDILITFPDIDDFSGEEFMILIPANDWIGILAIEETPNLMQALEQGDFDINTYNTTTV